MVKCPECGKEVAENHKMCPFCNHPMKNASNSNKLSSNKIIAIIAIIVIIAIVGVLVSGMFSSDNSTSDVKTESDTVDSIAESDDDTTSESTEYWASAKAEKFHLPTCEWAQKISEDNKIVYQSREDAIADGKVPCGACNP